MFIAEYEPGPTAKQTIHFYARSVPLAPLAPQIPGNVADVSPTFVVTYTQALASESHGLNQLTGTGLRKALEFLVKDFAIKQSPGSQSEIEKATLAASIRKYIKDAPTHEAAKRAAWLGNDETHYVRKWEDKDIKDLKVLIKLTINGIENVLLTEHYKETMPE